MSQLYSCPDCGGRGCYINKYNDLVECMSCGGQGVIETDNDNDEYCNEKKGEDLMRYNDIKEEMKPKYISDFDNLENQGKFQLPYRIPNLL